VCTTVVFEYTTLVGFLQAASLELFVNFDLCPLAHFFLLTIYNIFIFYSVNRNKSGFLGRKTLLFKKINAATLYFVRKSCPLLILKVGRKWANGQKM
jgi:hypothetical protein